jgi:hypothetical protein
MYKRFFTLALVLTGALVTVATVANPQTQNGVSNQSITAITPSSVSSAQGNGTKFQLSTGTTTTNDCVKFDANGNTVDNGSACGSGGSGGGTSGWSGITLSLLSTATQYTPPVGGALTSATETIVSLPANAAATLSHLSVTLSASLGTGTTLAVTLEDGTATPSALTCTTASAGTTCVDNTHSVNVSLGDLLSFKIVATGTVTGATPQLVIGYAVGTANVGVTSFSSGNLSPLFTTSVATSTTTPSQTFTASTFSANKWYGNNTGSTTTPGANSIGTSDVTPNLYAAGGGTAQAQTVTLSPAATALTSGLIVYWKPTAANTAAAPTLAVNGLTATSITKCGTAALVANDLTTSAVAGALYDGTEFQLLNPQAAGCGASNSQTIVTTASQTSVTFTVPSGYTNLQLVGIGSSTQSGTASDVLQCNFNGDTTSGHYNWQVISAGGSTVAGVQTNGTSYAFASNFSQAGNTVPFSSFSANIPAYLNTALPAKGMQSVSGYNLAASPPATAQQQGATSSWLSSAAITSIKLVLASGSAFFTGSQFTLLAQ